MGTAQAHQPQSIIPTRAISSAFGLCGFGVAILAGLAAGNSGWRVLAVAVVAMLVCRLVGGIAATILDRVALEHLNALRSEGSSNVSTSESSGVVTGERDRSLTTT